MPELRAYDDLSTLLTYETDVLNPAQAAIDLVAGISQTSPDFTCLVLFIGSDPAHPWLAIPIPSDALRNIEEAAESILEDGRYPVAYWKRSK